MGLYQTALLLRPPDLSR